MDTPKRFHTQAMLESYAADLSDEEFLALVDVLRDRRWTDAELAERVWPMRPELQPAEDAE